MQIQLNQAEIETAIREYVHQQINVREGMQIDITLKATRGEDGQTAIIDIVPKKEPVVAAPAVQRRPRVTPVNQTKEEPNTAGVRTDLVLDKATGTIKTETAGEAQGEVEQGNVGDGEQQSLDEGSNSTSSDVGATDGTADAASQSGEQQAVEQAGEKPRSSLFAGLSRPKNS